MKKDRRLAGALHVLLHMAQRDAPITSEHLAKSLQSNAVVIRRLMAGLREHGYVRSEKGHGGGWTLTCKLQEVTLRDIYFALGSPPLLAIANRKDESSCLAEKAVNAALGNSFQEAEALLLSRLGGITLEALSLDVHKRQAFSCDGPHLPAKPDG